VRVALLGYKGNVGRVLLPALEAAGHEVVPIGRENRIEVRGIDMAINFTRPDAVFTTVRLCLEQDVASVVGTTGLGREELDHLGEASRERSLPLFVAPNFAVGAVLMMRLAAEAARWLPRVEIIELHHESKADAPSGTAKATADALPGKPTIHSVRLPGLVAHQEVLLGGEGQMLTIRHDATSREAYVAGVLLAVERLPTLPPGLTVGLESLLDT
jgi:4-hydroxy-tetrahydrodipicolinate reductase